MRDDGIGGKKMEVAEDGRSVNLHVTVWYESDGSIRLSSPVDPSLRATIKNDPERPSGHPTLFKRLAQCLSTMGVPAPTSSHSSNG